MHESSIAIGAICRGFIRAALKRTEKAFSSAKERTRTPFKDPKGYFVMSRIGGFAVHAKHGA